jgi:hypothetical protein
MRDSQLRFIRQQGVTAPNPDRHLYSALMFQPRIIAGVTLAGIVLQSPWVFLTLSGVLWWGALIPSRNLFDAAYNYLVALPCGLARLEAALPPRRFAQGMAGTIALLIGAALLVQAIFAAWILQGFLAAGVGVTVFGDFCGPAHLYTTLRRAVHWAR